jgi:hypothetical protein
MRTITIEKYEDGKCVEKIRLPAAPLCLFAKLLPRKAKRELIELGLDMDTILAASTTSYSECWVDVEENKGLRRVRIVRHV